MSYRDLRNVTEHLRTLGYPNLISMESFRNPNFPLVADLLIWLTKRFDGEIEIPMEIDTEGERVALIRNVAQFMAVKANVKLNTKRLYQADGFAVKELLKITTLLFDALQFNTVRKESEEEDYGINMKDFDISDKILELKQARQLASEITLSGATLFDLLGKEIDQRSLRLRSVSRQFEVSEVEAGIKKAIESIKQEISETKQLIDNVSATEASLDAKIERRKIEIDRYEKRLQTLKKVKPAFLEEFQQLEKELEELFQQYSVRKRCLGYLEQLAAEAERAYLEKQQLVISSQRIVQTIPLDTVESHEMLSLEETAPETKQAALRQERPRARTGGRNRSERSSKVYGGMEPLASSIGSSLSSDSEDDLFLDKDEPELFHSDDDSLGLDLSLIEKTAPSGRKTVNKIQDNSDDDF